MYEGEVCKGCGVMKGAGEMMYGIACSSCQTTHMHVLYFNLLPEEHAGTGGNESKPAKQQLTCDDIACEIAYL